MLCSILISLNLRYYCRRGVILVPLMSVDLLQYRLSLGRQYHRDIPEHLAQALNLGHTA